MYFEVTYNFHTRLISFYFIFPTIVNRVYFKLRSSERFGSKKSTDIHLTVIQSTSYILPKYVKNIHSKLEAWRVKTSQTTGTLRLRFFFQRLRQFSIPITTSSRKNHLIYHREFSGDTGRDHPRDWLITSNMHMSILIFPPRAITAITMALAWIFLA